jgi:hypothetical protein
MATPLRVLSLLFVSWAIATPIIAQAGIFSGPDSYHECILEDVHGKTDDNAAIQAVIGCRDRFSPLAPEQKLKPFFWEAQNVKECLVKYLEKTSSPFAVSQIQEACLTLYPDTGESTNPGQ